jgi:hypothetical protein
MLFADEVSSEDEIDNLFNQLQVIEPPLSLVESIMSSVSQLPLPGIELAQAELTLWEGLIVRHLNCEPS